MLQNDTGMQAVNTIAPSSDSPSKTASEGLGNGLIFSSSGVLVESSTVKLTCRMRLNLCVIFFSAALFILF